MGSAGISYMFDFEEINITSRVCCVKDLLKCAWPKSLCIIPEPGVFIEMPGFFIQVLQYIIFIVMNLIGVKYLMLCKDLDDLFCIFMWMK